MGGYIGSYSDVSLGGSPTRVGEVFLLMHPFCPQVYSGAFVYLQADKALERSRVDVIHDR